MKRDHRSAFVLEEQHIQAIFHAKMFDVQVGTKNQRAQVIKGAVCGRLRVDAVDESSLVSVVVRHHFPSSSLSTAKNASWGTSTLPTAFMRFFPSFCFSSSLRLRLMSPP